MSDQDKMRERWLDWINNFKPIDDIGPQKLLPAPKEEWDVSPDDLFYVSQIVRQNGLPVDEDFIKMMAIVIGEMRNITETKMNALLYQYIIAILFDVWAKMPENKKFGIMKTALVFGMAMERSIDWEED
jgi:hypothetical protein